jgi:hypothetical protein
MVRYTAVELGSRAVALALVKSRGVGSNSFKIH